MKTKEEKIVQALQQCYDIAINAVEDHNEEQLNHALSRIVGVTTDALSKLQAPTKVGKVQPELECNHVWECRTTTTGFANYCARCGAFQPCDNGTVTTEEGIK